MKTAVRRGIDEAPGGAAAGSSAAARPALALAIGAAVADADALVADGRLVDGLGDGGGVGGVGEGVQLAPAQAGRAAVGAEGFLEGDEAGALGAAGPAADGLADALDVVVGEDDVGAVEDLRQLAPGREAPADLTAVRLAADRADELDDVVLEVDAQALAAVMDGSERGATDPIGLAAQGRVCRRARSTGPPAGSRRHYGPPRGGPN